MICDYNVMDVWKYSYMTQNAVLSFREKVGSVLFLITTCETSRKRSAFGDALQTKGVCSLIVEISRRSHLTPFQQYQCYRFSVAQVILEGLREIERGTSRLFL